MFFYPNMYHLKGPPRVEKYGDDRHVPNRNNNFREYTFADNPANNNYSHDQFAFWQGPRQRQDLCEYFRSTQNGRYYRAETQDELENRIISPGSAAYFNEITPERVAEDPGDEQAKYFNGWNKNQSDAGVAINMARSRARAARKGNYMRIRQQITEYIIMNEVGSNNRSAYADY